MNFEELIKREDAFRRVMRGFSTDVPLSVTVAPGRDEPWVVSTNRDLFGLALSGGGLRSASFNLGVLQGLAAKGVLQHVDVLSTVSGGGYIGGFWSALRCKEKPEAVPAVSPPWEQWLPAQRGELMDLLIHPPASTPFLRSAELLHGHLITAWDSRPLAAVGAMPSPSHAIEVLKGEKARERDEVRHLREFSHFLVPRLGFLKQETWAGLIAVVGGMVPTLLVTTAFIWLVCLVGVVIGKAAVGPWAFAALAVLGALGGVALEAVRHQEENSEVETGWSLLAKGVIAGTIGLIAGRMWADLPLPAQDTLSGSVVDRLTGLAPYLESVVAQARKALPKLQNPAGIAVSLLPKGEFVFQWKLLSLSKAWAFGGLFALLMRMLPARKAHAVRVWTRVASFFFIGALLWCGAVLVWESARWAFSHPKTGAAAGATGLTSTALFLWLREWLTRKPDASKLSVPMAAASWLKPVVPQLFAMLGAFVLVSGLVAGFQAVVPWFDLCPRRTIAGVALLVAVIALLGAVVDPSRAGLARFYTARIARAFIGAANPQTKTQTVELGSADHLRLRDMRAAPGPLHLVCCAANDMLGDELQTLRRGARSVVLSPVAVSIGDSAATPDKKLTLGDALSASAAAFNSQMGSVSMHIGRAVSFLMTAFNLRLGLWVKHPAGQQRPLIARWLRHPINLWNESWGRTQCAPVKNGERPPDLHLSDGGHFENLGLYELVRRHCRFIVVSDATADPDFSFEDLGNAIRRIREDFSIEIELNVDKIRPTDGRSEQHAVLGVIHYDGLKGTDKGRLVYLKASVAGGEPLDVHQYRARRPAFPHEPTSDQFYDEAQWESYRRLGVHITSAAFSVDDWREKGDNPVEALFLDLSRRWHSAPEHQETQFLALTQRCSALESELRKNAPLWFRLEFFPELLIATGLDEPARPVEHTRQLDELHSVAVWVMQIAQLMEDVWIASQFDSYSTHPLNQGWMAYFHRWANAPSFRRWWPLLRSIFSNDFANFMKRTFGLFVLDPVVREKDRQHTGAVLNLSTIDWPDEAARSMSLASRQKSKRQLQYELMLEGPNLKPVPVGSLEYCEEKNGRRWNSRDLRVPAWLKGGGFEARFLERVCHEFRQHTLKVEIPKEDTETVWFYKSRKFVVADTTDTTVIVTRPPGSSTD